MMIGDVRLWPKAEMSLCTAHVRFWGQSGHGFLREVAFVVLSGAKRTYLFAPHMSAFDPKRTLGRKVLGFKPCIRCVFQGAGP